MSGSADGLSKLMVVRLAHDPAPLPPPDSDTALVARAQAGQRQALQELYRRHVHAVYRRLTHLVGPDPDREDLVQHVFSDVFRGLHRFRGECRFDTYLIRVATHVAYDHLKRNKRRGFTYSPELLEQRPSSDPSPEAVAMRKQQIERVWRHVDRLKPKKRIAFLLRVIEGLTLEEIAEQVGAKPATVAQRIAHAQRELLAMLQRSHRRAP